MKRLILFELILIFLATTFMSDNPPGWYQQIIPRTDVTIQDIFFIDSLKGWTVARKNTNDTAFIFSTTNGGNDWFSQYQDNIYLTSIQFVDDNTGYSVGSDTRTGPYGVILKTTNGGNGWFTVSLVVGYPFRDVFFVNKDTGWICTDNVLAGGLLKTTDGGQNWTQQLNNSFRPSRLFFLNKDTGWAACNMTQLYRTTNGGTNWGLQFNFTPFDNIFRGLFFVNKDTGWSTHYSSSDTNGIYITTNGGFNWTTQRDVDPFSSGLGGLHFVNSNTGYIATGFSKIIKTTNSGINWFRQDGPNGAYGSVCFVDSIHGWAGGVSIVIHTTDGGGPPVGIKQTNTEVPNSFKLYQNYPNPFNPVTKIKYQITNNVYRSKSSVRIIIYDVAGKEVGRVVDEEQTAGIYQADFRAEHLSSGVYFYSLIVDGKFIDTKKMLLLR